jgi:hypothetical protein
MAPRPATAAAWILRGAAGLVLEAEMENGSTRGPGRRRGESRNGILRADTAYCTVHTDVQYVDARIRTQRIEEQKHQRHKTEKEHRDKENTAQRAE